MTNLNEVYLCRICGNVVEVLHTGKGALVCCGKPMELLEEKRADHGMEKHVPVLTREGENLSVKVGSIPHPMEDGHYIEWVELIFEGKVCRKPLGPNLKAEATFAAPPGKSLVRAYCNLHGLWKAES